MIPLPISSAVATRWNIFPSSRTGLEDILDLGETPLADRLITAARLQEDEPFFPLTLAFCPDCSLVQIRETVKPEILFGEDYPYYSSVSPALLKHFGASVEEILGRRNLGKNSLVLELASNDGYLLRNYVAAGIAVLGIDPASGPAQRAIENGVNTRNDFFTLELAKELAAEGVAADVIHGNNVLAHAADTNGFVEGIALLLKPDGKRLSSAPTLATLSNTVSLIRSTISTSAIFPSKPCSSYWPAMAYF